MKISMPLDYSGGFERSAQLAVDLERAGLDRVWVAEAYGFDAPSFMGYLAAKTTQLELASGIMPTYTRTPTLLAMTAAGVDALSGGRCVLGLGASGPQVVEGFHGIPYDRPLGRMREIVEICRKVWLRDGPVVHEGAVYRLPLPEGRGTGLGKPLKLIAQPVRSRIPIWIAALGERSVAATAELAEGWLPLFFMPDRADDVFAKALADGLGRRPSDLGTLEIAAGGLCAIGEGNEVTSVRDQARGMAALYIGGMGARGANFYNTLMRRYGFEQQAEQIQDLYLAGHKAEAAAAVPPEFLEGTSLCGSPAYIRERIAAYREAGVTMLNVSPVGQDPVRVIETLKELVG